MLKYIRDHYFNSNPACLLVIVDKVEPVNHPWFGKKSSCLLKPFARVSCGRTIINVRQSTYYQQFDDGSSDPVDSVPYCGPGPLVVLKAKFDEFLINSNNFSAFYDPERLPRLAEGIRIIREKYIMLNLFKL